MSKGHIIILLLFVIIISCDSSNKTIGGKEINMSDITDCCETCENKIKYPLTFHIKHESLGISELKGFKLTLILNGVKIYEGVFKQNIEIKELCESHGKFPINPLEIYMESNGKVYSFNKKSSIDIQMHKVIYIKLLAEPRSFGDRYLMKFENQLFYS
jgi:hypothetical protein